MCYPARWVAITPEARSKDDCRSHRNHGCWRLADQRELHIYPPGGVLSRREKQELAVREIMGRQFIFKHYWWIAPLGALAGIGAVFQFTTGDRGSLVSTIIAVALGFCYFAQQQKLAEMRLFKDLFTEFNRRYDDLNDCLHQIAISDIPLDETRRQRIVDYFNLCGEEYLFFTEGYIHKEAWRSWCAGMLSYLERERFRTVWAEESTTNSYYGLSLDVIERGAASGASTRRADGRRAERPQPSTSTGNDRT